jgi:LysR family hydrogen peroxide-inducible transcriptional activator
MAVAVETRSAPVCVARFAAPRPSRTIGMVWRRTSPLARQLAQMSEIVRQAAEAASRTPPPDRPAVPSADDAHEGR